MATTLTPARSNAVVDFSRHHARALSTIVALATLVALVRALLPVHVVPAMASAVGSWLSSTVSALTFTTVLCLTSMIALQYLAAAAAARAAAGVDLPYGELVAVQIAGTAVNSVTPAGLGGATLNGRYFARRGGLKPAQAGAAISVLAVLGGTADVLAFASLIGLGSVIGIAGSSAEVPLLAHRLAGWIPTSGTDWIWVVGGVVAIGVTVVLLALRREADALRRLAAGARSYRRTVARLLNRPGRLAVLMGASASTTLLMAAGFAAVATLGPAALPVHDFGALMIGYMVASAAGNAVPTPGGIGAADAAFTGVLLAAQVPVAAAVGTVLAYRLITFWAPVAAGAGLLRPLRRRGAL